MNFNYFPDDSTLLDLFTVKAFNEPSLVQFIHRNMAYLIVFIFSIIFYLVFKFEKFFYLKKIVLYTSVLLLFKVFFDCKIQHKIQNNTLCEKVQDRSKRTLRPKRVYEDGLIDFNKSAEEVDKLIRATTDPYPAAFLFYKGERYSIWKSALSDIIVQKSNAGEILDIKRDRILVQCCRSTLWLYDITDAS